MSHSPTLKRASIHTLGCRLNQAESALLEEKLRAAGYELAPWGETADLAIVHTCTVTREADAKSRKLVRQFIRKNPGAYTAVIGCYAQTGADALAEIDGVDLIVGNQEKLNVLDYVSEKNGALVVVRDKMRRDTFSVDFAAEASPLERRANLKVQDGCDFMCSFCIIPFARGRARSRELENLLAEARSLLERGAREIVLTGVNIGTYEAGGADIIAMVDALAELHGLARLRISSIEPTTIPEALFARMRDPRHPLVPYLHIPAQSGSDRILGAMRRRYTRQDFLDFIQHAHESVPDIGIGTDLMVGFPGETEEDFQDSLDLLWRSPLFYAHVFKYSERHGTASLRMGDKVDPRTANARSARLRRCSAQKTRMLQEHHISQKLPVLFEQQEDGLWTGYTENYLRVAAPSEENLRNTLREVKIAGIQGGVLQGEVL